MQMSQSGRKWYSKQKLLKTYEKFERLQVEKGSYDFQKVLELKRGTQGFRTKQHDKQVNSNHIQEYDLSEGFKVMIVESLSHVEAAVSQLLKSADDNLLSVDYEWTSDGIFKDVPFHKIALVSLASEKLCVLFRVSKWGYSLPSEIKQVFDNPEFCFLVQNPIQSDKTKLQKTFNMGPYDYANYINYADVLESLGYAKTGVRSSCINMWGISPYGKNAGIQNWERELSFNQIRYAAMDVFITGVGVRHLKYMRLEQQCCGQCGQGFGYLVDFDKKKAVFCDSCERWKPPKINSSLNLGHQEHQAQKYTLNTPI
eukprot:TRINITY_DN20539_c1_g1_i1.p1 TRINITY_DN20539_c1_g1~~TRINITY_DN20539_c1_g1_i1.p1  ORF type:complete len:313 (+),score=23.28 TRINITY_DN20539_c1_g1_i1:139-1077(+)